jgi:hypothetical protein
MEQLIARIARFIPTHWSPAAGPRALMESAGARAGTNALQARELRSAALAYLRVVR